LNSKLAEKTLFGFYNNGIFIVINCAININNKVENEIKNLFEKNKCSLAKTGSYKHAFSKGYEMKFHISEKSSVLNVLKQKDIKKISYDSQHLIIDVMCENIEYIFSLFKHKKINILEKTLKIFFKNTVVIHEEERLHFNNFIDQLKHVNGVNNIFYNA